MPTTLSDLRSQVISELDIDPKQRINATALLNRNINRALRKIQQDAGYALPENREIYTFTPTGQEQNLPSDFVRIGSPHGVKLGDSTALQPVDYFELTGRFDIDATSGGSYAYYIRKDGTQWIIGLYPVPNTSDAVTVPYYKKLTEMTGDTDESPLDDHFDEALVQYACYLTIRRKQGFEDKAANYLAFYQESVQDVKSNRQLYNTYDTRVGYQRRRRYNLGPKQAGDNFSV